MSDPIQHPVTYHSNPDRDRAGSISREEVIGRSEKRGPHDRHEQTVRPGKIIQIERSKPRIARIDWTCSHPASRKKGHNTSRKIGAVIKTARFVRGANFLAANPTAK